MSRKKNLSPTASLATCLDFAARVLSSAATVQEVCTKPVLAPMVVEAHRYGQQVMKHIESDAPTDARKLLRFLQEDQNSLLRRNSPLIDLKVADLTWDFEGTVADTLEMELEELQERAATSTTDTCVVISASSVAVSDGQAVIWFPQDNHDDTSPITPKKRQILLYMCPGRVKVVKSVGDLIKKMYDELPMLREKGAMYNVWAVVVGSSASNQQEEEFRKMELGLSNGDEISQHLPESCLERLVVTNSLAAATEANEQKDKRLELAELQTAPSNQDVPEVVKAPLDTALESSGDDVDQNDVPPVSPRFSVYPDVTDVKKYPPRSIFSFGLRGSADVPTNGMDKECEGEEETIEDATKQAEVDDCSPVDNQRLESCPKRGIVSSSLADLPIPSGVLHEMECGLGLGVRLKGNFAWQSCDGKVLRRSVRPQQNAKSVKVEVKEPSGISSSEDRGDDGDVHAASHDAVHVHEAIVDVEEGNCEEIQQEISEVSRSDDQQKQHHSTAVLPYETVNELRMPRVDAASPLSLFTFERLSDINQIVDSQASVDLSSSVKTPSPKPSSVGPDDASSNHNDTMESLAANSQASAQDEVPVVKVDEDEPSGHPDLTVESDTILPILKTQPAPVNYKDKLGARIWWELEYTAARLEREKMMERDQEVRRRQGGHPVKGNSRIGLLKSERLKGPQRREPTGWSKNAGSARPKEVPVVSEQSVCENQQELVRACITTLESEPPKDQDLDDDINISSSSPTRKVLPIHISSRRDSEMKVSPDRLISPSVAPISQDVSPFIDNAGICQLSGGESSIRGGDHSRLPNMAAEEEDQTRNTPVVEYPDPRASTSTSHERASDSLLGSLKATYSKPAVDNEFLNSLVMNPHEPERMIPNNQQEDEDETLTQMMWGSTHTSYERDHNLGFRTASGEEEIRATEAVATLPFSVRGRVPIRIRRASSKVVISSPDDLHKDPSSCSSTEHAPFSGASPRNDTRSPRDESKPQHRVESSHLHRASMRLETESAIPTPPPVATFIALGEDTSAHSATSSGTRQDRLNELRQKKLRKLKQARDVSIQQQKEKQHQRQAHRPLSFANSVYSKKASNRQLMQNALEFTLLAGGSMEKERTLALLALAQSTSDNFIVLLKSAKELKFRALYENHVDRDCATRIFSVLPSSSARAPMKLGSSEVISQFFKYSSAKKQFLPVPTRSFTVKTDACALVHQLVFNGKPKPGSSALSRLL